MSHIWLQSVIEGARGGEAFRNYLHVRDRVLDMLEEAPNEKNQPSEYWKEELVGFDYPLDASPLVIQKLRQHCYHLTGVRANEYRRHHAHRKGVLAKKLEMLRRQDGHELLVPEPPLLGGFGYEINGALFNLDTLKYYECLIALDKAGWLAPFRTLGTQRRVVIEIGAGWGGFAYQFKTLFPNTCYIIIDFPQTLLFSGVYLKTLFPHASTLLYGEKPPERLLDDYKSYDFIFLPHFFFCQAPFSKVNLAVNIVSFQEMTSAQVDRYVRKLAECGCPHLYSLNRDRSPYNQQLTGVSGILQNYYQIAKVSVLDIPYTMLPDAKRKNIFQWARSLTRKLFARLEGDSGVNEYQHLTGYLRQRPSEIKSAGFG